MNKDDRSTVSWDIDNVDRAVHKHLPQGSETATSRVPEVEAAVAARGEQTRRRRDGVPQLYARFQAVVGRASVGEGVRAGTSCKRSSCEARPVSWRRVSTTMTTATVVRALVVLQSALLLAVGPTSVLGAGARLKVTQCNGKEMVVETPLQEGSTAYIHRMKTFTELDCQPKVIQGVARFRLALDDVFRCGITRVTNQLTGTATYWTRIAVEAANGEVDVLTAKCTVAGAANRTRRNVLPAGFQEEEVLEVRPVETMVQPPQLGVEVRQGGQLVTGELNVNPGTPLSMEIFLDEAAAPIYGLLVSHMTVSDTKAQEETIVFNGCSVDPYLFDNFNTVDGDFLSAKFRAFKFPESSYVQFRGTVTVCLDKCRGVECSNGVVGYGRRKRAVDILPPDPNKVFEVALSAFIKVQYQNESESTTEKALLTARSDAPVAAESGNVLGTVPAASSGVEVAREELPDYTVLSDPTFTSIASIYYPATYLLLTIPLLTAIRQF